MQNKINISYFQYENNNGQVNFDLETCAYDGMWYLSSHKLEQLNVTNTKAKMWPLLDKWQNDSQQHEFNS